MLRVLKLDPVDDALKYAHPANIPNDEKGLRTFHHLQYSCNDFDPGPQIHLSACFLIFPPG